MGVPSVQCPSVFRAKHMDTGLQWRANGVAMSKVTAKVRCIHVIACPCFASCAPFILALLELPEYVLPVQPAGAKWPACR